MTASATLTPRATPAEAPLRQLELLCDPGSFRPLRSGVASVRLGERATPGDGVVAGGVGRGGSEQEEGGEAVPGHVGVAGARPPPATKWSMMRNVPLRSLGSP